MCRVDGDIPVAYSHTSPSGGMLSTSFHRGELVELGVETRGEW